MESVKGRFTDHGFTWGAAEVSCLFSDAKKGWVMIGVKTPKADVHVYVTKTGKVRVFDHGSEWKPANKSKPDDGS